MFFEEMHGEPRTMKKGVIGAIIAGAVFIFLLFFVVPFRSAKTSNGITTYPIIPILSYTDYHIDPAPAYPGNSNENAGSRYIGGHGAGFFGIPLVVDKYYVYEDGHKERIQILFFRFGEDYEKEKADKEEVDSLTRLLADNSGCENIKTYIKNYDRKTGQLKIAFWGVTELAQADSIAFAMNSYISEHTGSLIHRDKPLIQITLYESKPKYSVYSYGYEYCNVKLYNAGSGETVQSVEIKWIDICFSKELKISELTKLRVPYTHITVPVNTEPDDIDAVAKIKGLEELSVRSESRTVKKGGRFYQQVINPDYESYKKYCESFNRINYEKGYLFANISIHEGLVEKWKKEYGKDFVYPVKIDAELKTLLGPADETFKLTLNEDYTVKRDIHQGFKNLRWNVIRDGNEKRDYYAERTQTFVTQDQWKNGDKGTFMVFLTADVDGKTVRVSNIIKYYLDYYPQVKPGAKLEMTVNGEKVPVTWENNSSVEELKVAAFYGRTIKMTRRDKYKQSGNLETHIGSKYTSEPFTVGDIVLENGNRLAFYYWGSINENSCTKLGKIDLPPEKLEEMFSHGFVEIKLKLIQPE